MSGRKLREIKNSQPDLLRSVRKADIFLILIFLLVALLLAIFFMMCRTPGGVVKITCDGMDLYEIDLAKSGPYQQTQYYLILFTEQSTHIMHSEEYPELPAGQSYNLLSVTDGAVTMEAADCRDQICVRHKAISGKRENIICLPHKLVVEITGGEDVPEESLDGVVK